jgi:hypothetical protein
MCVCVCVRVCVCVCVCVCLCSIPLDIHKREEFNRRSAMHRRLIIRKENRHMDTPTSISI